MRVEMWSDVTCPFSYIGKRLFDKALKQFPHREHVHVTYRSYVLDKQPTGVQSISIVDELIVDWDCTNRTDKLNKLRDYAETFGMNDPLTKQQRIDTLDAHRLVKFAATQNKGKQLLDLIEEAYFIHNEPIGEHECLQSLGEEVGLSTIEIQEVLASCMFKSRVRDDMSLASEIGVKHVPYLVLNETCGIPTMHQPDQYAHIIHAIWNEYEQLKRQKEPVTTTYCNGEVCEESIR